MTPLGNQVVRVIQDWRLVVAAAVLAAAIAAGLTLTLHTSVTAYAALTTSSLTRSPDQDAYLAQGYSAYFNEPSYQQQLASKLDLGPSVTFTSRTAATSPIIFVEATAADAGTASNAAVALASRFRDDMNKSQVDESARQAQDIQQQIADTRARLASTIPDIERLQLPEALTQLEGRLADVQGNSTNQIKDLQLDAGVTRTSPSVVRNGVYGLVGGLVLGLMLVLLLGVLRNRLATPFDVRSRLGLDTLAVVDADRPRNAARRERQLKALANAIAVALPDDHATLAVVAARSGITKSRIAEDVSAYQARRGTATVLVRADLTVQANDEHPGLLDLMDRPGIRNPHDFLQVGWVKGLTVLPLGLSSADPYLLFTPDHLVKMLSSLGESASVVVDATPMVETAESQATCAAAGGTLLVVERGVTGAVEAAAAVEAIRKAGGHLLGVVLVGTSGARSDDADPPDDDSAPADVVTSAPSGVEGGAAVEPTTGLATTGTEDGRSTQRSVSRVSSPI